MFTKASITCVIPARLNSTRLTEKVLRPLGGISLLERVWHAANNVPFFSRVIIAVDDPRTAAAVEAFGGTYVNTSVDCINGTHRLIEVMRQQTEPTDIWVNWQADEPFIKAPMIADLLSAATVTAAPQVWTLCTPLTDSTKLHDPNTVKVIRSRTNHALYFSRAAIPYQKTTPAHLVVLKHIGLYAYNTAALERIATLPSCPIAEAENLEQLQFLTAGIPILVSPTHQMSHGIDTLQDLLVAEQMLGANNDKQANLG